MNVRTFSVSPILICFHSEVDERALTFSLENGRLTIDLDHVGRNESERIFIDQRSINDGKFHRIVLKKISNIFYSIEIDKSRRGSAQIFSRSPFFFDRLIIGDSFRPSSPTKVDVCFSNFVFNESPVVPSSVILPERENCFLDEEKSICDDGRCRFRCREEFFRFSTFLRASSREKISIFFATDAPNGTFVQIGKFFSRRIFFVENSRVHFQIVEENFHKTFEFSGEIKNDRWHKIIVEKRSDSVSFSRWFFFNSELSSINHWRLDRVNVRRRETDSPNSAHRSLRFVCRRRDLCLWP